MIDVSTILQGLSPRLNRSEADPRQIVLMTCGIAGSGKSTLSKAVTATHPNFERISVDEAIFARHGLYAIDYPAEKYQEYQDEAGRECELRMTELLGRKDRDILLDRSFYSKQDRVDAKQLVEQNGARWVLVYLKADREVLWRRIQGRKVEGVDANSAFDVTEEVLDGYIESWEAPEGEGEVVVHVI